MSINYIYINIQHPLLSLKIKVKTRGDKLWHGKAVKVKKFIFLIAVAIQNCLLLGHQIPTPICPSIISDTYVSGTAEGLDFGSYDGNNFWIANYYDSTMFKISKKGILLNTYNNISATAQSVASDGIYVWIGDTDQWGTLQKFSIAKGKVVANYHFNFRKNTPNSFHGFNHIIWDGYYLWLAAMSIENNVYKFNTTTEAIALTVTVGASVNLLSCTIYQGQKIILGARTTDFIEINADTGAVTCFASADPGDYHAVASDGAYIYEADFFGKKVSKYKLSDGAFITKWATDGNPNEIAWDGSYIWTSNISYTSSINSPNTDIFTTSGNKICKINNSSSTDIVIGNGSMWGVGVYDIYQIGLVPAHTR